MGTNLPNEHCRLTPWGKYCCGRRYVQEWGIYPTSEDGDYYSFINALRQDQWGAVATRLNGTGYLSMNSNLPAIDYSELQNAGELLGSSSGYLQACLSAVAESRPAKCLV